EEEPLAWSELRRKLPVYAVGPAEAVLREQLAQGKLYRHPRAGKRGGERYGVRPPDPKEYLRGELAETFHRLGQMGFTETQLREAALDLLHDEEWSPAAERPREEEQSRVPQDSPRSPALQGTSPGGGMAAAPPRAQTVPAVHPSQP